MENIGSDEKLKSLKKISKNNQEPIAVGYGEDTFDVQDDISISKQIEKNRRLFSLYFTFFLTMICY